MLGLAFEVAGFQTAAAIEINQFAFGYLHQMTARFAGRGNMALIDEVEVNIVSQIRCIVRISQLAAEQATEPSMIVPI